jgi:hypothetical protein
MPRNWSSAACARGTFDADKTVLLDNRPHGNGTDSRAGSWC